MTLACHISLIITDTYFCNKLYNIYASLSLFNLEQDYILICFFIVVSPGVLIKAKLKWLHLSTKLIRLAQ